MNNIYIYLSPKIRNYWISSSNYYSIQNEDKFLQYFFNFLNNPKITSLSKANTAIFDIQLNTDKILEPNKLNIMLCVENCPKHKHYKHYNKYKNYNNGKIQLYLYNHISHIEQKEKYMAIPIIYIQIDYLKLFYNQIKPSISVLTIPFDKRKFCLITTKNNFNNNFELLSTIGECRYISEYSHLIANKSCYHSKELLDLFAQFKFIYVSENSFTDGYITEKIFNAFFARTIPLYLGPSDTLRYFNSNSFINMNSNDNNYSNDNSRQNIINKIKLLNTNEIEYYKMLNSSKINDNLDTEDYINNTNNFINNLLTK